MYIFKTLHPAPQIPTIDQAYSKISNSITVEWATVPGATSYLLTAKDGNTVIETTVANSPGTVTGHKAATLYQITVRSISPAGEARHHLQNRQRQVARCSSSAEQLLVTWINCTEAANAWCNSLSCECWWFRAQKWKPPSDTFFFFNSNNCGGGGI